MSKKSKQDGAKVGNEVQIFSSLVQMKFKPTNENGVLALSRRREKMSTSKKLPTEIYDPLSMVLQADRKIETQQSRRLKFIASLSADHFIVGNENQIDMISFGSIAHGFVDTEYFWSITRRGPIESVTVDAKKSIFLILSENTIYFYRYNAKAKQQPTVIAQIPTKEGVRFIRFLKDILLGIFYNGYYQIYNVENLNLIKKKLEKKFDIGHEKVLLTIPPSIDNIINVFFEEAKQNKQSFILWCMEINFEGEQIKTREPYRVYDIMNYVKGKLSIQNYTKDIIFMNLNHQIMAIKNGYLIDTVNVSVNEEGEILKYIHPQTILHITKKNVEVYNFSINMAVKPEKIVLRSIDSIELKNIPAQAFYISVLQTFNNNFAIFFEDSLKKRTQTNGQISYYFEVSETTSIKHKINTIFESIGFGVSNPELIQEKYNMAKKMGLTEKEIYLEIWNRSNRSSLEDYQYILATRDYKTIKAEIEKKLKKQSMVLREILRIEQGCFDINRAKIESQSCSEQDFQDFITSHFLMRKLKLYRQINVLDRMSSIVLSDDLTTENRSLKIDIQQYYLFKNSDIKTYLIQQISDMLFNFKNNAKIIRIIIKQFKFAYRIIYKEILEEIIIASKQQLVNLLNEIPELLPYIHPDLNDDELKQGLYDGIWGDIHIEQWENNLYPERLETIHNKQSLRDLLNSIWYKRYWLTSHDMVNRSKKEIVDINKGNNSEKIFYFFISKLYEYTKNNRPLYYQLVNFLQQKYQFFPAHLRSKTSLYEHLFIYYYNEEKNNPAGRHNFAQFLELDDEHLFKYFFDHQKVKKNSLLKEVKPIYEQSDSNGSHIFNIGLFSYFYSDLSAISDLKFILNRINNEKTEFHQKNYGIYQVLVKSMQLKLRLGGEHDIPMDQVMIYIQNIPLDRNNHIMEELTIMQGIKEEASRFVNMKINMSVKEIMDNCDLVIGKIISYQIKTKNITKIKDWNEFRQATFELLKEIERVRIKLYHHHQNNLSLLVYLSNILQEEAMIQKTAHLLEDHQLHDIYQVQEKTVENIVLFMYKWSFSKSAKFIDNEHYLRQLFELLPHESECRRFLEIQLDLGLLLSSAEQPLEYPLSETSVCLSLRNLQQIFRYQSKKFLLNLNLQKLFDLMSSLQHMVYAESIKASEFVTLHKLYELLILELLEKELYKEVITYIYKILSFESPVKNIGILYIILFIYKIADQFNDESRKCIFKLLAVMFNEPVALLKIVEFVIKTKLTGLEQTKYLRELLVKESTNRLNFNANNNIFSKEFTNNSSNPTSRQVIEIYRAHLKTKRQEFQRQHEYDLIFTILCHSPYLLTKFLDLLKHHLSFKTVKAFLILAANRPIFNPMRIFELLKRIFAILTISSKQDKQIEHLLGVFQSKSIEQEFQVPKFNKLTDNDAKIFKITTQLSKIYTFHKRRNTSEQKDEYLNKRLESIQAVLQNPFIIFHEHLELDESEDQKESYISKDPSGIKKRKKINQIPFDYMEEHKKILTRVLPFREFLVGRDLLVKKQAKQSEIIGKKKIPSKLGLLGIKDNNYLHIRNQMIQHLYSHKVVSGSECSDDPQIRKEDEDFLDSFVPNKDAEMNGSRISGKKNSNRASLRNSAAQMHEETPNKEANNYTLKVVDNEVVNTQTVEVPATIAPSSSPAPPTTTVTSDTKTTPALPPAPAITRSTSLIQQENEQKKLSHLKQVIVKSYNELHIPKFDLSALEKQIKRIQEGGDDDYKLKKRRQQFLVKFIKYLYHQPIETVGLNLKLMEDIARKHPELGINIFFLQAYERIYGTHEKYGLELDISALLPITGVFIKSKDIMDLYHQIEQNIIPLITDENLFKLSKLLALGFRKNVVEQEILFNYLKIMTKQYLNIPEQELGKMYEKIKSLLLKLQAQVLVDRGEELFKELNNCDRRTSLLDMYSEGMKNKGYLSAARDLASKLQQ